MNWKICGFTYSPFQRAWDRHKEGEMEWCQRMAIAWDRHGLTDDEGQRFQLSAVKQDLGGGRTADGWIEMTDDEFTDAALMAAKEPDAL